ncbi:LppM family (lipo)protein [Actinomyces sp. 594]|uniref:LppM family (lipo)protein n=1 Tax=Actinomyces sp. 594 TaxID=2057793 RepID=UPI00214BC6BB|nr:hypothetical protein [Actinomyces sp. 594]
MAVNPCLVIRHSARPRALRGLTALAGAAAVLLLSGCTAHMDMRLDASGTYDADLVMRDTTGTVFTDASDCQELAAESLVGTADGVGVTASPLGSADDADGLGCEVHVTGVPIPDVGASGSSADAGLLVARDGDLYVVHLAGYGNVAADASGAEGADGAANDDATAAAPATADSASNPTTGPDDSAPEDSGLAPTAESLNTVVDAHLSITFPGAVVDAGGGTVSGTTVTWEDADVLYDGVSASGYATAGTGVSTWDRYGWWIVAGVAGVGAAVGAAALRRHRS